MSESVLHRFLDHLCEQIGPDSGIDIPPGPPVAIPYLLAAHLRRRKSPAIVVVSEGVQGKKIYENTMGLLGPDPGAAWMPAPDADPYESLPDHPGILLERSEALSKIISTPSPAVFLPVESLLWKVPLPSWWRGLEVILDEGKSLDRGRFRVNIWRLGYTQQDSVTEPGEAAFRGGIIDIFPPAEKLPVRVELFGDEVERLSYFDPSTQRSLGPTGRSVAIRPLSEAVRDEGLLKRIRERLTTAGLFGEVRLESLDASVTYPTLPAEMRAESEFFGPLWLHIEGARWIWLDRGSSLSRAKKILQGLAESHERHSRPAYLSPSNLFASPAEFPDKALSQSAEPPPWLVSASHPRLFPAQPQRMMEFLGERVASGFRCLLIFQGHGTMERVSELAQAQGLSLWRDLPDGAFPPGLYGVLAQVEEGLDLPDIGWMAVCENEFFSRGRMVHEVTTRKREAFLSNLRDLKVGDAIVHLDHGVASYRGIETITRNGIPEDFVVLRYRGGDKLLVPVQRMDLLQKYSGNDGHKPPLDKLGGTAWKKAKERVRKATREVAAELLQLYSRRKAAERSPFSQDSHWQEEFEAQFPFELTPDQARAIADVKRDMESPKPMDRVVCGDVGFGKTEVAMRASFKAVADGKQVEILCPTTVLALQHMERFSERFAPFPCNIAMLSRFQSPKEQKAVVAAASGGKVDILVGTHRILSKDVVMPRLGLLVVDEEQRFGVVQKEKIKQLKSCVDVLTLTATPIPRTLQMGLSGILDMSLIQTSPRDRLGIQTVLHPMDKELIVGAIKRELARGGQVFYVHNQIETIAHRAAMLKGWIPEAKIAAAHGRMGERALEEIMLAFFHGQYDVLVCTTIIENGVDLAKTNTLIVENAQNFGLCQLYQLRGRIGRSDVPSYAFLLTPEGALPDGDAARRLETLQEFSELGAGFRIAAVDLELRGAGDFLGTKQSGHIEAVGFDLYLRMLEEAVSEARGEAQPPVSRCEMSLGLELSIPPTYIQEVNQRLCIYRDLSLAASPSDVDSIEKGIVDRFGKPPEQVARILMAVRLRIMAERCGIGAIHVRDGRLKISCRHGAGLDPSSLATLLSSRKGTRISPESSLEISLAKGESPLPFLEGFFDAMLSQRAEESP